MMFALCYKRVVHYIYTCTYTMIACLIPSEEALLMIWIKIKVLYHVNLSSPPDLGIILLYIPYVCLFQ